VGSTSVVALVGVAVTLPSDSSLAVSIASGLLVGAEVGEAGCVVVCDGNVVVGVGAGVDSDDLESRGGIVAAGGGSAGAAGATVALASAIGAEVEAVHPATAKSRLPRTIAMKALVRQALI